MGGADAKQVDGEVWWTKYFDLVDAVITAARNSEESTHTERSALVAHVRDGLRLGLDYEGVIRRAAFR